MFDAIICKTKIAGLLALFLLPAVLLMWHQREEDRWRQLERNDPKVQREVAELCARLQSDRNP